MKIINENSQHTMHIKAWEIQTVSGIIFVIIVAMGVVIMSANDAVHARHHAYSKKTTLMTSLSFLLQLYIDSDDLNTQE